MASRVGAPINVTFGASFTVPSGANAFKASGIWYDGANQAVTAVSGSRITVDSVTAVPSSGSMGTYSVHGRVNSSGSDTWSITKAGFFSEGPTCQVQFYSVADNTNFVRQQQVVGDTSGAITRAVTSTTSDLVDAWIMSDGGGTVSGAISGFTAVGTEQTTNADKSRMFQANSPGASSTSITGPANSYPGLVIASIYDASSGTSHAATGALVGPGAVVAGSVARTRAHGSSGALTGPGAQIVGTAQRNAAHTSSGALTGPGSTVSGSAARTRQHASSGDLTGQGSAVAGSAVRTRQHAATGDLTGPGSALSGSADRTRAHGSSGDLVGPGSAVSGTSARTRQHGSSGDLVGPGSAVVGSADHITPGGTHDATGVLVGQGSSVSGSAARFRAFTSSGALVGPGSVVTGSANRAAAPVSHDATGVLVGPGSVLTGAAQNGAVLQDTHDGFWANEWRKLREREKKKRVEVIRDEIEEIEEQIAEVEAIKPPKQSKKVKAFIAERDFYSEQARIVEQLIAARQRLIDMEEEEMLLLL